ncbi:MAG: hypothetical protein ABIH23_15065 [bacterium]
MLIKMLLSFMARMGVTGLNWYTIDTLTTAIVPKTMKFQLTQLFKNMGYVVEKLWAKTKVEKINKFEVPLHHRSDGSFHGMDEMGQIPAHHGELVVKGYDDMRLAADMVIITHSEFKDQGPAGKFIDLVNLRISDVMANAQNDVRRSFWRRTAAIGTSDSAYLQMLGFYDAYATNTTYGSSSSLHDLSPITYSVWKPYVWDATALGGTANTRAGIRDDTASPTFLPTVIGRVVGYLRSRKVMPGKGVICMGASLMDILSGILMVQDHRVPDGKYAAKMGYRSINFLGYDVVEDDGMSENQSSAVGTLNTDGWIVGFNLDDVDIYVDNAQKLTMGKFIEPVDRTYFGAKLVFYRQMCFHALNTMCIVQNIFNEKGYIPSF